MASDGCGAGAARGSLVCVTGGSGFIGSWLVRFLLDRGYTVHATVKNLEDEGETKHLQALDGADTRLRLFQMDLLDLATVRPPVEGARGVFHLASPVILHPSQDPENELLEPALKGTLNVLRAAKDCGAGRVVMVSSQTAMAPNPSWPADKANDSWADVELLKKLEVQSFSKTYTTHVLTEQRTVLLIFCSSLRREALVQRIQNSGGEGCLGLHRKGRVGTGCAQSIMGVGSNFDAIGYRQPPSVPPFVDDDDDDDVWNHFSKKIGDMTCRYDKDCATDCVSSIQSSEHEYRCCAHVDHRATLMATDGDGAARRGLVCVTGGSGFIGSWLVRLLLDRGYTVHATVKNLQDEGETEHLQAMDGADTRLRLFQMDLLDAASIQPAIDGAQGVFHLASPVLLHPERDLETELLEPAWKGALNVLRAAKDCGAGRVVMVSSQTAMVPNPSWPADKVIDEDSWADVELIKKLELWYSVSKTMAEKAAWDFAGKEGLELVVLNPAHVLGPTLAPSISLSLHVLLQILKGQRLDMEAFFLGIVDVRDVAQSLIVLYENPSARGRHLCLESSQRMVDFTAKLAELYPELPVQRIQEDKQDWLVRAKDPSKKLIDLGVRFTPFEKTIKDTMDCFKTKGLI